MLASVRDYFFVWQLPVLLGYIVAWLVLGAYLLRRPLRDLLGRRKGTLGRCVLAMLLSGLAAGFAGAVIIVAYVSFLEPKSVAGAVVGLALAGIGALAVAFLVIYAMFNLSGAQTFRAAAPALGALLLVGLAGAAAAGVPAYIARQREISISFSQLDLGVIRLQVGRYRDQFGHYPDSLGQLLDEEWLKPEHLQHPASDRKIAYFYVPPDADAPTDTLLACDRAENQGGRGRVVVHIDESPPEFLPAERFEGLLSQPVNAGFAEALRTAEAE